MRELTIPLIIFSIHKSIKAILKEFKNILKKLKKYFWLLGTIE